MNAKEIEVSEALERAIQVRARYKLDLTAKLIRGDLPLESVDREGLADDLARLAALSVETGTREARYQVLMEFAAWLSTQPVSLTVGASHYSPILLDPINAYLDGRSLEPTPPESQGRAIEGWAVKVNPGGHWYEFTDVVGVLPARCEPATLLILESGTSESPR